MAITIDQFQKTTFSAAIRSGDIVTHDVYTFGRGAPVIIMQELPGIGPQTLRLAGAFIERGFAVVLPHLFGPLGKVSIAGNLARVFCMRKELHLFAAHRSSPLVDWLKALCRHTKAERSVDGVGVIGMCLTGNFAISLIGDDSVLAAVAAQPAMPLHRQASLHMSAAEIAEACAGIDKTAPIQAYRFAGDWMSTATKFNCIDENFNIDGKTRVELKTLPGKGHAVLTLDFVDRKGHPTRQALDDILDYFAANIGKLKNQPAAVRNE